MEEFITAIFLIIFWIIIVIISYKYLFYYIKKIYSEKISKEIRFFMVKIPRKESDLDQKQDNTQNMKQNIEIMNQVFKNFYSIYSRDFKSKYVLQNYISLEILVEKEMIKFIIWTPKDYLETFEKMISGFYPGSVIDKIEQPKLLNAGKFADWWYFILSKDNAFPIKTYQNFEADPMDSLLSAFSRVDWEEKLCLQILVSPLAEKWQKKVGKSVEKIKSGAGKWFFSMLIDLFSPLFAPSDDKKQWAEKKNWYSQQQIWDIEKKIEDEWFNLIIRTLAVSPNPDRAKKIIKDIQRAFSQYNYIWLNTFTFLQTKNIEKFIKDFVAKIFIRPFFTPEKFIFFIRSQILNIKELSSIFHFPHSRFNKNPRIKWQNFKIVPPPDNLPQEWILIWHNLFAGVKKEIKVASKDRFRHFYLIWQTWTWKSSMLLVQAKQDAIQNNWFALIDPHGDLCEFIIKNYPKDRIEDLIYFNAGDFDMPIWFNAFEADNDEEKDLILNDAIDMFVKMYWPEIFGPRIQDYFLNWMMTLMDQPEWWTLIEIVRLFADEAFQKLKIKNVKNPVIRGWWEKTFKSMWEKEKAEIIPYFQAKFGPFTTLPIIRNIIWQPKSSFNIADAMQEGKVILLNLSKWKMWEVNSKLLWTMMVSKIKSAALRRASLPEDQRKDYFLYIDEFQNYITQSIETILSEARKYRLWLIIAHQYIEQLVQKSLWWETDLRPAVFGNVWSIMAYKVGAKDAEYLEQEFSPEFSRSDLVNMDKFKWVMKLSVDTQPTRPFSISVLNPYEETLNTDEKVKIIKEISRLKRWRKRELIEKEIYYRMGA